MHIELSRTLDAPTIIIGFPGIGLVGPIVTEFLVEHMKTEPVGKFVYDELPALAPVHKGVLVHPMSLHYSAKHNTLICYTILDLRHREWAVVQVLAKLASDVHAKEVVCIDGASTVGDEDTAIYCFGNPKFKDLGAKPIEESVVVGVGGALLLTLPGLHCLFAATHSKMPDSKAAAEVVKFLDKYLALGVDYQPLLAQAQQFEEKLKSVMNQSHKLLDEQDKKSMNYLG